MRTNILGRTRVELAEIGLGTWPIGGSGKVLNYGEVSEKEALACLETYIEAGGNHIDTARAYNDSERRIGLILKDPKKREKLFVASKTPSNDPEGIRKAVEESLRLLQTEYVDLYYMHMPPDDVDEMNRALDAYEQLREEGKIRFIGASIKAGHISQATVDLCRQYMDTGRVDVIELIYSIIRQKTREIFQEAKAKNVGLVGRTALENGFLTGKYKPGHEFSESAGDHRHRWTGERLRRILAEAQKLKETAVKPPYETLIQVAIRFAMMPDAIASTIVGAKSVKQVRENLRVLELPPLDQELVDRLIKEYSGRDSEFN